MTTTYVPPNIVEIAQNSHKLPLSHKIMTAHLLHSHGNDMMNLVSRLFKEAEEAKAADLTKIVSTLLPYFFIKSDNAIDLKLSDEIARSLKRPQEFNTESLERIVRFIQEESAKNAQ